MLIFPAIDIREGRAVRLSQGDYERMTVYSDDPAQKAAEFMKSGATCLHVVDLDGAKDGGPRNRELIARLAKLPMFTQLGGGMRSREDVENALSLGIDRVIIGTLAVTDFESVKSMGALYDDRLAVGVDAKGGVVATHGWKRLSGENAMDFCKRVLDAGISTVIYTDISKDGQLSGTNLAAYEALSGISGLRVVASGGITKADEISALRGMGIYGAIVGKALYAGRLTLEDALLAAKEGGA